MPRNLRDFWVTLNVDGYAKQVSQGPRSRGGGFHIDVEVASHGDPKKLLRISGMPLRDGKNRVIIEIMRPMTAGEEVYNTLTDGTKGRTLVLEEERECHCNRAKYRHK